VTKAAKDAAKGHTGRKAGDYEVVAAALNQAGVWLIEPTRLGDFDDAMRIASLLAGYNKMGRRTGVISIAGSECVIAADAKGRLDIPPLFSPGMSAALRPHIPRFQDLHHPLDLSGAIDARSMLYCIEEFLRSPEFDSVIVGLLPQLPTVYVERDTEVTRVGRSLVGAAVAVAHSRPGVTINDVLSDANVLRQMEAALALRPEQLHDPRSIVPDLIKLHRRYPDKPLLVAVGASQRNYSRVTEALEAAGIPCFDHMDRAIRALDGYVTHRLRN